ncbi:MAG: hypothetical protein ACOCRK_09020 [bacterium]
MKLNVSFKLINPDFDIEYAKVYHNDKESKNSHKYLWEETLKAENEVDNYEIIENGEYSINNANIENGNNPIHFKNLVILKCLKNGKVVQKFIVSKDLLEKKQVTPNIKYNITRIYFYLKSSNEIIKIKDGFYVLKKDIPKDFLR